MPEPRARSAGHITHNSFNYRSTSHRQARRSTARPLARHSTGNDLKKTSTQPAALWWSESTGVLVYNLITSAPVLTARHTGAAKLLRSLVSSFLRNQLLSVLIETMFYSWPHAQGCLALLLRVLDNWRAKHPPPCHMGTNGRHSPCVRCGGTSAPRLVKCHWGFQGWRQQEDVCYRAGAMETIATGFLNDS